MIGRTLGHYEITAELGKGGMGEVWRAKDTKLGREVAIKTLPEAFAQDEARLSRFEREAKLLAPLNHPNIGAIHGLEEFEGTRFLVLELIEGDTLAERLQQGPIPVEESLRLALQITEALEAAHEKGVIHRDLKPANIKITPDGNVKVLDFGLAKAFASDAEDPNISNSLTLSAAATQQGVILGTAAYMSPEQAKGIPVDKRSDIFSFGCVLFEMLTGRQAFQGELATEILASVIRSDPDYTTLQANLHPRVKELLRRCFEKDVKNRWQAVGDVRVEIENVLRDPQGALAHTAVTAHRGGKLLRVLPWAATVVIGILVWTLKPSEPRPIVRFHHELPDGENFTRLGRPLVAISPDGTQIVYVAGGQLHLRHFDDMAARPIAGTDEDASGPFFSTDGQWVGFFSNRDGQLKKIPVTGGAPVTLCDAGQPYGASWGVDGTIVYALDGILRVSANGGAPDVIVEAEEGEQVHGPEILPGGESVLFTTTRATGSSRWDEAEIVVESLDSGERKVLWTGGADARYVPTGHIVYALEDNLFAIPFDLARLEVAGGPVPLVEGVRRAAPSATASAHYGVSERGSLVYVPNVGGAAGGLDVLALADQSGVVSALDVPPAHYRSPRVSPDGKKVAVKTQEDDGGTIWVYELSGVTAIRRLTHEGNNARPIWTPDGERVTFASEREETTGIYWTRADGSGVAEPLMTGEAAWPESWSPDGRTLSFSTEGDGGREVRTFALEDGSSPEVFAGGPGGQQGSAFSPDGKWLAYTSGATGPDNELFVEPFPRTGARHQVTRETAFAPVWAPDGRALFYRPAGATQSTLKVVDVNLEPAFSFTNERALPLEGFLVFPGYRDYDITPDGEQFVVILPADSAETGNPSRPRIHIVLNWFEELKERVPVP